MTHSTIKRAYRYAFAVGIAAALVATLVGSATAQVLAEGKAQEPEVVTQEQLEALPKLTNWDKVQLTVAYPDACYNLELEGTIAFQVLLSAEGKVDKIEFDPAIHPAFKASLEAALAQVVGTPARYKGAAIDCWMPLSYTFDLKAEKKRRKKQE